jgi:hypothetical protein
MKIDTSNPQSVENNLRALVEGLESSRNAMEGFVNENVDVPKGPVMAEAYYHVADAHTLLSDPEISVYVQAVLETRARKAQAGETVTV